MYRSDLYGAQPGFSTAAETFENQFKWGKSSNHVITGGNLSGAARDAGNTPTTVLRPGLLLGRIATSGLLKEYSATASDGSGVVVGVLMSSFRMQDLDGNNTDRFIWMLVAGPVQAAKLYGLDATARNQMSPRFLFDDDISGASSGGAASWQSEVAKATNYTVTAADAGTMFTTTGATGPVTFTLPAKAPGLGPFLFMNTVAQNMVIASAGSADDIVALNDAGADTVTFSTAGQLIGAFVKVTCNAAGTKWYCEFLSTATATVA